jgi:ATP-dependent RNA helicase SUPV3L1/SUV3
MDKAGSPDEAKTLRQASTQALAPQFNLLADRFYNAPDPELDFTEQGGLMWGDAAVGKLTAGSDPMKPDVVAFVDDEAGPDVMAKVQRRLQHFIDRKIAAGFESLSALKDDETLVGAAKGFAFRLIEGFGIVPRGDVADEVKALDQDARGALRKHGIRFGQFTIFMPLLLKPAPTRLRLVLWSLSKGLAEFPESPPPGLVTVPAAKDAVHGYYAMSGYRAAGARAIRIDMLERLADMLRDKDSRGGFEANADMLSITGMTLEQFADLMTGLGYKADKAEREKIKTVTDVMPKAVKDVPADQPVMDTAQDAAAGAIIAPDTADGAISEMSETETPVGEAADAKIVAAEIEVYYTFTWAGRAARTHAKPARENAKPTKGKGKRPAKGGDERQKFSAKPKVEKKIDPDNPFAAALAGFKKG